MGYKPTHANNDVWIQSTITSKGQKYYEYILCYTEDILSTSKQPEIIMNGIAANFNIKGGMIEELTMYLGAIFSKMINDNKDLCWAISSKQYCKTAVQNVNDELAKHNLKLITKFLHFYNPSINLS